MKLRLSSVTSRIFPLYLKVFKLSKNKVVPLLGILGSLIIVGGGIISNPNVCTTLPISLFDYFLLWLCLYEKKHKQLNKLRGGHLSRMFVIAFLDAIL